MLSGTYGMCLYLYISRSQITKHDLLVTFFEIIQGGHGHCSCCCIDASVSIANTKLVQITAMNTNHRMVRQVPANRYKHMPEDGCGIRPEQNWSDQGNVIPIRVIPE